MGAAPPKAPSLVTKQQYDAALRDFDFRYSRERSDPGFPGGSNDDVRGDYGEKLQQFKDTMSVLPPPTPDLADETVQRARQAARRKLLMGGMTGPIDLSGGTTAKPLPGLGGT